MTHDTDRDFNQFRGAFDDAITPDSTFTARMEKLLQSESPVTDGHRQSPVLASPRKPQSSTVIPTRHSHPLMVAAAVLTVFAVVITSVWVLSGDVLEGNYASAPGDTATMPANAPGTPGPDVQLSVERFPRLPVMHDFFGVYGDTVVVRAPVEASETQSDPTAEPNVYSDVLMALNVETGEEIWALPFDGFFVVGASNTVLVGYEFDWSTVNTDGSNPRDLVALDLATGERLWSEGFNASGFSITSSDAVVLSDVIITMPDSETLQALNLTDGSVAWEAPIDAGDGRLQQYSTVDGETREEQWFSVSATAWNGNLAVINGDGLVQIFDSKTGNLTTEHDFAWTDTDALPGNLLLYPLGDSLLLNRLVSSPDVRMSELIAFDPATGSVGWQRGFEGQVFVDVADNGTIAVNSSIWETSNWLMRLFGNHGHSNVQFSQINGITGNDMLVTERGRLDDGPTYVVTDNSYACTRTGTSEIVCFDRFGTRYLIEIELQYQWDLVDGVLYIPTQDGLFTVDLP